jgi:uncharacterized protein YjiS (DUF1127 family)
MRRMAVFPHAALRQAVGCLYCSAILETLKTESKGKDTDMTTANAATNARQVLAAGAEHGNNNTVSARLSQAWEKFRAYRATLADLRALTDRQLGDVGLTRATLREAAHRAVYGR